MRAFEKIEDEICVFDTNSDALKSSAEMRNKMEILSVDNDKISIIIPVYNAELFIKETIDCIRKQTYADWELLLVEDSSGDRTLEVMEAYAGELQDERIHITRREVKVGDEDFGAAKARNLGLKMAKGRYIAYLDADDLWVPEKLEKELKFLKEKQAGFVFTGYEFGDEEARGTGRIVHVPETLTYKQALANTTIFTSTVMLDTARIEKGLLEMPYIKSEDTATWWKILKTGVTAYGLDENLVIYRRAGKTLSSNKLEALRRIWNLYRKSEGLSVTASCCNFVLWAVRAVKRRL